MKKECKIENNLFNDKKIEEFIKIYDEVLVVDSDKDPIKHWIDKLDNNELENEKANYINFFEIILKELLGYKSEDINYESNVGSEGRPVEFTLKKDDKDFVVVELKGTKTKDLNKRYNREQSAIEQVTNYASIKEETVWAFVSNYNEFRLFNPNYRERYISFKFKQLTDPTVLKKFLLILGKFSLIEKDIPQTLLKETRIIERELEDEFYKLFSETRLMLIKELENSSEDIDRIEAIRLSQLILNRFIFLCFAEDLKLIPSETTADVILTPIRHKNLYEFNMWNRINELFIFADKGNAEREIPSFNGGLFKENLKNLEIRDKIEDLNFFNDCYKSWKFEEKYDEIKNLFGVYKNSLNPIYKNLLLISSFDFGSEVSVNILGHIFENSIGDIEELKDETTKRRKKDGVFYTPEHITDYICRNTIIPYLSYNKANTVHELISEYESTNSLDELDKKLKEIKIIDIACGSGAFLNKAVDVLFDIHKTLHESKYAEDKSLNKYFDSLDSRRQIISNNIYGVDLNEESVEITKLSLFLKLATSSGVKEGFTLPNLNKNIKCGNSLIDDESVDEDKAFNWNEEFNEVLSEGGFDIIIGNPPYVRQEKIKEIKPYLKENYYSYTGVADLYVYFFEKGLNILKESGFLGFICSNKYTRVKYGKKLREFISNYDIKSYNDLSSDKVFKSATVDASVILIQNTKNQDNEILIDDSFKVNQKELKTDGWSFKSPAILNLEKKIISNSILMKDLDVTIKRGISTGYNEAFIVNEEIKNELINKEYANTDIIKSILRGRDINKWQILFNDLFLLYIPWDFDITNYPAIEEYLNIHKKELSKRPEVKEEKYNWYCLSRYASDYIDLFEEDKIIWQRVCKEPNFTLDTNKFMLLDSMAFLTINNQDYDLKYILCFLNSPLTKWFLGLIGHQYSDTGFLVSNQYVERLPIVPLNIEEQNSFIELTENMLDYNKTMVNEINSFKKWLKRTFEIDKLSAKLENYYELSFDDFLKEVKKKKIDTTSRKTQELLETEFNNSVNIIKPLKNDIQDTELEINQLIYSLYELTDEEINIIENGSES